MSRASVANASVRAGAWRNLAFFWADFRRLYSRFGLELESLVRWGVPASLVVFMAIVATTSFRFARAEQDRILAAAMANVELAASAIATDVDVRIHSSRDMSPTEAFAAAISHHTLSPGQSVLLSDGNGAIIASYPAPRALGFMSDHLGTAQPLTVFAEEAGAMRLTIPSGTEALATVHAVHGSGGQVAIVHPIEDVLSDWRSNAYRTFVLLAITAAVLVAFAFAYFMQATRAQQANSSCRMMRDRVDMVLSRGRCGLWDWNLASGRIAWSLSMFELLGMAPSKEALSFVEIEALTHPNDGGLEEMVLILSSGSRSAADHVFRMRRSDGGWVWLRAKAELVQDNETGAHLVGIAVDVTETMALEERTAKADMRLRDAIETISEAFVVWDAENRLVMCNSKFQRFYNLPVEAVAAGTPYAVVMELGTAPLIQSQVALGEAQPLGARTFEVQLGDGRWLQVNERRTKDGGYVSVGTDITALKSSVAKLNNSRQALETQAQQLAELAEQYKDQKAEAEKANRAKSDFLANMGHELRTPLNAILGFSEMMMLESFGALGSPVYSEYCRDIHASGQYLTAVIADVLEMSRLDAGRVRLEKVDFIVEEAIRAALGSVSALAAANSIAIRVEPSHMTGLLADRTAVEKILTILLNNAVKYTPADGKVTVRTRAVQGALNIYVEDTGVGIPPEAIARLGRPFEQSDQSLKNGMRGSGLGLAIARSLVDLHGGSLRISSRQGAGTTVQVHLPNRQNAPRPRLQLATSAARAGNGAPRFALQSIEKSARKMSRTA